MRELIISILLALALLLVARGDCYVEPVKPPIPPGCQDLVLECICDQQGFNCHYVWVCIRN